MKLPLDDRGQGPPVVLLHGFPLDRSMWTPQIEALSSTHRVIAPDLRGHGEAPAPHEPYPMEVLADDVVETLDAAGIEEPWVIGGLSMGGYVALALAERAPERLRGLILLNTRSGADSAEVAQNRERLAREVEERGSAEPVVGGLIERLFASSTRESRPELIDQVAEVMRRALPSGVAGALRGMAARPDRTDVLRKFDRPVLVIAGAEDPIVPEGEARNMAESALKGQLVVVPQAGHLTPLEAPAVTTAAMRAFLDGLS